MELFLFRHNEYEHLYNCTNIIIDSIPIEKRKWTFQSFVDISALIIIGFIQSWLSFHGTVFCSYPTFNYIIGSIVLGLWIAESTADIILALNRIRLNIWLLICSVYALYWVFFAKPVFFSGIHFAWFFFPFIGYKDDVNNEFVYNLHNFHDLSIAILSPVIYLLFVLSLVVKNKALRNENATNENINTSFSRAEKMTFIQVFIISLMNTVSGSMYVLMQHITPQRWLIILAQFSWLHIHGFPPVIYLFLNKTIRNDCLKLLQKIFRKNQVSNVNGAGMI
ncbi:hypothetical protein Mgra_00006856 [Meloidogyne graminicola]|uniref:7TM_GPCR_Srx domain-containing protein n=1 Tax=Meloidogyne graminicola TaxID=189291 RepID=A0A8S9ZKB3_9BILA|nr:hypothetical protein Mgra_00006856 [Meloidogyne graminicola]